MGPWCSVGNPSGLWVNGVEWEIPRGYESMVWSGRSLRALSPWCGVGDPSGLWVHGVEWEIPQGYESIDDVWVIPQGYECSVGDAFRLWVHSIVLEIPQDYALTTLYLVLLRHCLKFSDYVRMVASARTHGAYQEFRRWSHYLWKPYSSWNTRCRLTLQH